jgi:hypothetical protein
MNTSVAIMHIRMKPLPRRHRIAHLRALLRRPLACPVRRKELAALRIPPRAIAAPSSGAARANADHSHSHQSLLQARPAPAGPERQQTAKPAMSVSPELAVCVAGRTT